MGVEALVKDTAFEALIIGAADGLDKRAQERRRLAKKMEDPKVGAALASEEGGDAAKLAELAKHVKRDAEHQANVATWLRTLVGGRDRDARPAGSESKADKQSCE